MVTASMIVLGETRRRWLAGAVVAAGAAALGFGVAVATEPVLFGVAALVVAALLLRMPLWVLPAIAVAAAAGTALLRIELFASGSADSAGQFGQGRVVILIASFALYRSIMQQQGFGIPRGVVIVTGIFAGAILFSAFVGLARGSAPPELWPDVQRQLSWVAGGFLVGALAMTQEADRTRVFRALAVVAIAASVASVVYWAWVTEYITVPPQLDALFVKVRFDENDLLSNIEATRSRFPFVDQHPNFTATIFVALAAFTVPPLIRSRQSTDVALATLVMVAVSAGVLTTQSRTGIISLGLAAVGYLVLTRGISPRLRFGLLLAIVAIGVFVFSVVSQFSEERSFSEENTLASRRQIWAEALEDVDKSPFIGNGFGYSVSAGYGDASASVHSEYLGRLVDGGIVGLGSLVVVLAMFAYMGLALARQPGHSSAQGVGLLIFLAVIMISMMVGATWVSSSAAAVLSWVFFGMATATYADVSMTAPRKGEGARAAAGVSGAAGAPSSRGPLRLDEA